MKITPYLAVFAFAALSFTVACSSDTNQEPKQEKVEINAEKVVAVDYKIEGMTCKMGCAKTIEKTIAGLNGVVASSVDFDAEKGHFEFDASIISEDEIITAIEEVADQYKVKDWSEEENATPTENNDSSSEASKKDDKSVKVKMPSFKIPNLFELLVNQL